MVITKADIIDWLNASQAVLVDNAQYLTKLDSAIGDADHGTNMSRGFNVVVERIPTVDQTDIGNILKTVGMALMSSVGGASGPLYGTFYMKAGMAVNAKEELTGEDLVRLLEEGMGGIVMRGRAQVGDKTMIDAWTPAIAALKEALANGDDIIPAVEACVAGAEQGMKDTIPIIAKKGRASYLGERSIGHQDPGATSTYLILNALLETLKKNSAD